MTTKIAVSLPDELVAQARLAVEEGRASSVSAYVAAALVDRHQRETIAQLLARMSAELGAPTAEDVNWARSALDAVRQ